MAHFTVAWRFAGMPPGILLHCDPARVKRAGVDAILLSEMTFQIPSGP